MATILIIDDDTELCALLKQYLGVEGFDVEMIHDGEQGALIAQSNDFDGIILDVMLPHKNGFEVLKSIREKKETPILMLTARGDDIDRIVGLEIGADDYLAKPCNPRELVARLRAILRRTKKQASHKATLNVDDMTIDVAKRVVTLSDNEVDLTNAEFNILEILAKTPGQAFSKEELTEKALGRKFTAYDRSIDVHISNLRNKMGKNSHGTPRIKTVRGFGYMYDA